MNITKNERAVLQGAIDSEYGDGGRGATYTFSAIEHSGLDGKIASGVISSLIQKRLAVVGEGEKVNGTGEALTTFDVTDLGHAYLNYTPVITWEPKLRGFNVKIVDREGLAIKNNDAIVDKVTANNWIDSVMPELGKEIIAKRDAEDKAECDKWNKEHAQ
jgi:hypothetical protein